MGCWEGDCGELGFGQRVVWAERGQAVEAAVGG